MTATPPSGLGRDDPLDDFDARTIVLNDAAKRVYVTGSGPAVIVMTEMPGISPQVARFSRWVRDAGFTVYMPSLFGRDGAVPQADEGLSIFKRTCVSAEFHAFGGGASSPVTHWLRALARLAHEQCGGPGVGAIGMCFTGNFALAMLLEPALLAPVLCQPSLPLDDPAGIEIAPDELRQVRARLEREDLDVLAYRFDTDRFCTAQRFDTYAAALGKRFLGRVLPDSAANGAAPPFFARVVRCPHSVVTAHLIDEAGQPTLAARDEILGFFAERLHTDKRGAQMSVAQDCPGLQPMPSSESLPVLLVPGIADSPRVFQELLPRLFRAGPVMVVDHTRDETVSSLAARVLAHAPPRFSLAGLSLGGYVALEILRRAPERVSRLALLNTSARPETAEGVERRRAAVSTAERGAYRAVVDAAWAHVVHPERVGDAALKEVFVNMRMAAGVATFVRQQHAIMTRVDSRASLGAIKCPTWVLVGDADAITPLEVAQEMAAGIQGARLVIVPRCGHLSPLEQPQSVGDALLEWLET